jgi:hypothetical protein
MRSDAVKDFIQLADILSIDPKYGRSIDVGGTKHVSYDSIRSINPLEDITSDIVYLDKGFNIDTLDTTANVRYDFLDPSVIDVLGDKFNFVYSFDTIQYVPDTILFFKHIASITHDNGYVFISTVFNWQYQADPEDYFRFTPFGLHECFIRGAQSAGEKFQIIWRGWGRDNNGVILLAYKGEQLLSDGIINELTLLSKHRSIP